MKLTHKKSIRHQMRPWMVLLLVMLVSISLLSGCKKQDDTKNAQQQTTSADVTNETEIAQEPMTKEIPSESDASQTPAPPETTDLLLYGIQNETLETEQMKVSIPKDTKITPELIVNQVVSLFEENSIEIGIDSVTMKGDTVVVSFQADKAPLVNVGSGVETTILDSISMSLLDNISDCKKVIFQVEGKAYMSGHIELGIDEVYKWK